MLKKVFSLNLFLFRLCKSYAPGYFIYALFYFISFSVLGFVEHMWTIKTLTEAIEYSRPFSEVLVYIGIIFTIMLVYIGLSAFFYHHYEHTSRQRIFLGMQQSFLEKAKSLPLSYYDNPRYYRNFIWAIREAPQKVIAFTDQLWRLLETSTEILCITIFVAAFDPVGLLFVFLSSFLSIRANSRIAKNSYKHNLETLKEKSKVDYFFRIFYLPQYAKELRTSGLKNIIKRDLAHIQASIKENIQKYSGKNFLFSFLADFVYSGFFINGLYLSYLILMAIFFDRYSYGVMVALFLGIGRVSGLFGQLSYLLPQFQENALYVRSIRRFLNAKVPEQGESNPIPEEPKVLEFRNVSFRYADKGETVYALKDLTMTIHLDEITALLGVNGAGKTTMIKLLLRLYEPSSGSILLDGVNINQFDLAEYREMFSTIFQDYQIYAASLAENVLLDELKDRNSMVLAALHKSHFTKKLESLPQGVETKMTRELFDDGHQFSGGESQKLALSRVFCKESLFGIMDEYSSALDPQSEYEINKIISKVFKDHGALFITHRIGTTVDSDRIFLMDGGSIIEEGTHGELMEKRGKYYEMFTVQNQEGFLYSQDVKEPMEVQEI